MSFAASGQLIDGDTAVFMPRAGACNRGLVGGISRQCVAKLKPALHKPVEVGEVGFDLGLKGLVHRLRLGLVAGQALRKTAVNDQHAHQNGNLFGDARFLKRLYETSDVARVQMPLTFRWQGDKFAAAKWFDHWTSLAQVSAISISYWLRSMFAKSASSSSDSIPDRSGARRGAIEPVHGTKVEIHDSAQQSCGLAVVVGCC